MERSKFFFSKQTGLLRNSKIRLLHNKKADNITLELIIFVVLNILFVITLMIFVIKATSSSVFLEEAYAKQIATLIDGAKPGTTISINMADVQEIVKKNKLSEKDVLSFNSASGRVLIKLVYGNSKYSFQTFSGYDVEVCYKAGIGRIFVHKNPGEARLC